MSHRRSLHRRRDLSKPLPSQLVTLAVSTSGGCLRLHAVYDGGNVPPGSAGPLLERFARLLDDAEWAR